LKSIQFLSTAVIPIIITFVVIIGITEKKNVLELFLKGVIDGQKIIINLFPTLLALLIAVGMLSNSGVIDFLSNYIKKFFQYEEIVPLILLRPISGSSAIAIATNIMTKYGVDTEIGLIASIIMGSTETTIYVVSIYTAKLRAKNIKPIILIGLIGDMICVICAILAFKIGLV